MGKTVAPGLEVGLMNVAANTAAGLLLLLCPPDQFHQ